MTPKEKAKELLGRFDETLTYIESKAKARQCALIAVELLIECTPSINIYPPNLQTKNSIVKEYWQEVKQEIEKL